MIKFDIQTAYPNEVGIPNIVTIYMIVDNEVTHIIFSGSYGEAVERINHLKEAIPFASFEADCNDELFNLGDD